VSPTSAPVPPEIERLGAQRAEARRAHDWTTADRLRAEIEAAGWNVIDSGVDFRLEPAHPPDLVEGDRVRYGSSASVPSRLSEAPTGLASVIVVATDWAHDLERCLRSLRAHGPAGTQVVIIADGPTKEVEEALGRPEVVGPIAGAGPEVVWTSERLGHAAALDAGVRRAAAPVVVWLDTSVELAGDAIGPLVRALDDERVGVAGGVGLRSSDLRRFSDAPAGDVDAVAGYCLAFRRADAIERGPLDERFRFYRNLDIWWSLVLRDEGEGRPARRAVAVDLPLVLHEHRGYTALPESEVARLSKRNFYRIIDRFGHRYDLLLEPAPRRGPQRGRGVAGSGASSGG
jgi:hypothetical protein